MKQTLALFSRMQVQEKQKSNLETVVTGVQ